LPSDAEPKKTLLGIVDLVPSYTTLLVVFDDDHLRTFCHFFKAIRQTIEPLIQTTFSPNRQVVKVVIP